MYIIVIGIGEVGKHLLSELDQDGHDVVAVDRDPAAVRYAEDHYDVMSLTGYGASEEILLAAGVRRADMVVAVSDNDEVNLIATLAAKQLGAKHVVARIQGNEWARAAAGVRYGLLGVDVVINPRVLVAQELARVARSHGASEVVDLAQAQVELVQLQVGAESRLTEKPLASLDLPPATLVAGIVRDGDLFIPGGADLLLPDDRVYLIGRPEGVLAAEGLLSSTREARRVCIVGGGVVGHALALELSSQGSRVLVIERDPVVAEALAAELEAIEVVQGDGTDQVLLEEEDVEGFDLFVAVTQADEINLMACLLAKRVGVSRTACIVQRADYVTIYRQLGIDVVLSPRTVASDQIIRWSRGEELHNLTVLEDGKAEVLELTAEAGCRAVGTPLKRMNLPRGSLVAALVRDGEVIIPKGDDEVKANDRVILMTLRQARSTVVRLFRPRRM